jgi:hypothetical protein
MVQISQLAFEFDQSEPRRTRSQCPLWVISGQTSSTPKSNLVRYSGVCIIANLFPMSQTVLNKLRELNYV